jgi:hypothetical protein
MVRVVRSLLRDLEEEITEEERKDEEARRRKQERPEPTGVACNDDKEKRAGLCELRTGVRVVVRVRDRYYGRHGTVMGKKGTYFWNIKLDAGAGKPACVIYKKCTSLVVVEESVAESTSNGS